ncbi:hypothetical protein IFM89_021055 [Coptis chinensis]|uniref:Pentatricopeptide repeat-containing protein n=1 Tax=Coptis chinensis TaxID=261450 RepID=A0A835H741_9MAGN|nr:hypothetical protein IFM89_021055 [Coptis chinensis]
MVITSGCCLEKFVMNHLINMYCKCGFVQNGDLDSAKILFDEMPERNLATWNAMVGVVWGKEEVKLGQQIHGYVMKSGIDFDLVVGSSLAHMYMKCGNMSDGEKVFEGMHVHNVIACNTIIAGRAQNGCSEGALDQFNLMKLVGLRPDKITFVSVISTCSELATLGHGQQELVEKVEQTEEEKSDLGRGRRSTRFKNSLKEPTPSGGVTRKKPTTEVKLGQQIHGYVMKSGIDFDLVVGSSLAHMYMKCENMSDGEKVFEGMPVHNVIACNTIIVGRAQNGCSEGALDQFNLMKLAGLRPDKITFVSVISTCSELATLGHGQQELVEKVEQTEEEKSDLGRGRRSTRFKNSLKEPTPWGGVTRKNQPCIHTSHTEVVESCPVCRETAIANNA